LWQIQEYWQKTHVNLEKQKLYHWWVVGADIFGHTLGSKHPSTAITVKVVKVIVGTTVAQVIRIIHFVAAVMN